MQPLALRFSGDYVSSSGEGVPRSLLVLAFVVELIRRFLNWILTPLRTTRILDEASNQYPPHDPLTLWPRTPFTTATTHNSSSSSMNSPLQSIRENLPAVVEYGSLGADRQENITYVVCLTDFWATDRIHRLAGCGHFFHMKCLDRWINYQRYTCPLCRSPTF